jgi:hypothetical protein
MARPKYVTKAGQIGKLTRIIYTGGVISNPTLGANEQSLETINERKSSAINTTVKPKDSSFHNNGASTSVNPLLTPSKNKLQSNSFGGTPCKICDDLSGSSRNIAQVKKSKNPLLIATPAKDTSYENRPSQLVANGQATNFNSKSVKVIQRNSDYYRVNPSWHVGSNSNSPRSKILAPVSRGSYMRSAGGSDEFGPRGSQRRLQRIQKVSHPVDCPEYDEIATRARVGEGQIVRTPVKTYQAVSSKYLGIGYDPDAKIVIDTGFGSGRPLGLNYPSQRELPLPPNYQDCSILAGGLP